MRPSLLRLAFAALIPAIATAGCSGIRHYVASPDENVRIETATQSGVRATVHIHSVDENCRTAYLGSIPLDRKSVATGIPAGRKMFLVFAFNSASFLGNRRTSISYRTLVTPRRGHRYRVAVEYVDDTYNAEIFEIDRGGNPRELRHRPLETCGAGLRNASGR